MRKSIKVVAAASVAGLALAGGSAFTATGIATSGNADAPQFVGGTVSQAVTGATLNNIVYTFAEGGTNTAITGITLTFLEANADGKAVTATPTGAGAGTFDCDNVGDPTTKVSHCDYVPAAAEAGYIGLTSLAVNVASSQ